jgi:hypothetical protein
VVTTEELVQVVLGQEEHRAHLVLKVRWEIKDQKELQARQVPRDTLVLEAKVSKVLKEQLVIKVILARQDLVVTKELKEILEKQH